MHRRHRSAAPGLPLRRAAVVLVALVASLAAWAPAHARSDRTEQAGPEPGELLDRRRNGADAVRALGDGLPEAARRNGRTPRQLEALLRRDPTAWLDPAGRLLYVEPVPSTAPAPEPATAAPYPLAETFALHSRPGAARVLYLDFDGHVASGTAWNLYQGLAPIPQPPFDLDGTPGSFGADERTFVQAVWRRVAEDYAPFEVDVTTEEPPAADITRTGTGDGRFGARVVITPSFDAAEALCQSSCGGVAYVGAFDEPTSHALLQPAWVFSHALGNREKTVAEAATHEAGHTLGLSHDGVAGGSGYYAGHGPWAPIMGVGYNRAVTQWSAGEYAGADNPEDDVAVIAARGAPLRADDHGGAPGTATVLTGPVRTATGVVSTRADRDVFAFDHGCTGPVAVRVDPAPAGADLDVAARLLAADGTAVAVADPPVEATGSDAVVGLAAGFDRQLSPGRWYVEVDGTGALAPGTTGYSDYGSLGAYTVSVTGCGPVAEPDLAVTGPPSISPASPVVGETALLSARVENRGTAVATGGTVTVALSGGLRPQDVRQPAGCSIAGGTVTCPTGDLEPSGGVDVVVAVVAVTPGPSPVTVTAGGVPADPDPTDDAATSSFSATGAACTVVGTAGRDVLDGTAGPDVLCGLGGDDRLRGFGGPDVLVGGDGADVLLPGAGDDRVAGSAGWDRLEYADATGGVVVDLRLPSPQATGGSGADAVTGVEHVVGSPGADRLTGGAARDVLDGGAGNDTLTGHGGDDTLLGGDGVDVLRPGAGNDRLDGGAGTDLVTYDDAPAGVRVDLALTSSQWTGGSGGDRLVGIEKVVGSPFADRLRGDGGPNALDGRGGSDTLFGLGGGDALHGGDGHDVLHPGAGDDRVEGGAGTDLVDYGDATSAVRLDLALVVGQWTGGSGGDRLAAVEKAAGSPWADRLWGDGLANALDGRGGDDVLHGRGGPDRLYGGPGTDLLDGGGGADGLDGGPGVDLCAVGADGGTTSACP